MYADQRGLACPKKQFLPPMNTDDTDKKKLNLPIDTSAKAVGFGSVLSARISGKYIF
jgi:hypothetical protein